MKKNATKIEEPYVEPLTTELTHMGGWYYCRVFDNGKPYKTMRCESKRDIGRCFREIMRWYAKTGGKSRWAWSARERLNKGSFGFHGKAQEVFYDGLGFRYPNHGQKIKAS